MRISFIYNSKTFHLIFVVKNNNNIIIVVTNAPGGVTDMELRPLSSFLLKIFPPFLTEYIYNVKKMANT